MKSLILALTFLSFNALACTGQFINDKPPAVKYDQEICDQHYAVLFDYNQKIPVAVGEHLTPDNVKSAGTVPRVNAFHGDMAVQEAYRSIPADYDGTGYDRGHMAPSGDMPDKQSQYESFSMANMTPQNPKLNRNSWRLLETHVRDMAEQGDLYVVTGALGNQGRLKTGEVIPAMYYKAVDQGGKITIWVATNSSTPTITQMQPQVFKSNYGYSPF